MDDENNGRRERLLGFAQKLNSTSKVLSRFFMRRFLPGSLKKAEKSSENHLLVMVCTICGSTFQVDNFHVRFLPKMKMTKKIEKLLVRYNSSRKSLGSYQKKMVMEFLQSKNKMVIRCHVCKKAVKVQCQDHKERLGQRLAMDKTLEEEPTNPILQPQKKKKKKRKKIEDNSILQVKANEQKKRRLTSIPRPLQTHVTDSPLMEKKDTVELGSSTIKLTCNMEHSESGHKTSSNKKSSSSATNDKSEKRLATLLNVSTEKQTTVAEKKGKKFRHSHQQLSRMLSKQKKEASSSLGQFLSDCS